MKEVRSGYKRTKVGVIPMEWAVKKLGEIGDSKIGLTYSPDDVVDSKGLLVLRSSNIRNGSLVYEDNVFVNKEVKEELLTKENDILICARNGSKSLIGKNALITSKAINLTFGAFMSIYRSEYNKFLFQMFQTELYKKQISINLGATINQITTKNLNDFIFPIPPINEQEKIVEILSTWDSAIEKQEQLIEKKKEFKKGLMQRLLSGEVRFKNFKDDWKTYKVNNLTKQVINKNKDGNISLVLSVTNKKGFITQEEQFEKQVASKDLSNYKIVRKGEFAYNPSRINVGSIDLLTKFSEGLLSPMYIVFKCDEQLLSEYYNYWIKTNMFKKQMDKYLSGSVRETLSFEDMGLMKIKLPSMEEQKMIVDLLNNMNTEIELLEKELEALKLQKKGLMQRLLIGEVRVKV